MTTGVSVVTFVLALTPRRDSTVFHPALSYPLRMRLLLILMMVLLPLRAWVGDAMAINMAAQQVQVVQVVQATAPPSTEAMPDDCPMKAGGDSDLSADGVQAAGTATTCNCDTCDLCLALASLTFVNLGAASFIPHAPPPTSGTRFSSAERGINLKPPIS